MKQINNPTTPYGSGTRTYVLLTGITIQTDHPVDQAFLTKCALKSVRGIAQSGYTNGICWRRIDNK